MRVLLGTVSALALAAAAVGLLLIREHDEGARNLPGIPGTPPAVQRELDRRQKEREEQRRKFLAQIEQWERDARAALERERAEHKDNPFVQAGERRYVEDWRLAGGHYDHLSAGLWTPAFETTGQDFWTPWFFFQGQGGNVKDLEIAYWYGSPTRNVTDGPIEWTIRAHFSGTRKLTYELAVDCLEVCTPGWRRYQVALTGPGTTRIQGKLRAYRAGFAKVISLE